MEQIAFPADRSMIDGVLIDETSAGMIAFHWELYMSWFSNRRPTAVHALLIGINFFFETGKKSCPSLLIKKKYFDKIVRSKNYKGGYFPGMI
jgi:hypothetical protein